MKSSLPVDFIFKLILKLYFCIYCLPYLIVLQLMLERAESFPLKKIDLQVSSLTMNLHITTVLLQKSEQLEA